MKTAKVFQNGRNQEIRLPKEFRFKDDEVYIKKMGNAILLIPKSDSWGALTGSLGKFSDDFMNDRSQPKTQVRESF